MKKTVRVAVMSGVVMVGTMVFQACEQAVVKEGKTPVKVGAATPAGGSVTMTAGVVEAPAATNGNAPANVELSTNDFKVTLIRADAGVTVAPGTNGSVMITFTKTLTNETTKIETPPQGSVVSTNTGVTVKISVQGK